LCTLKGTLRKPVFPGLPGLNDVALPGADLRCVEAVGGRQHPEGLVGLIYRLDIIETKPKVLKKGKNTGTSRLEPSMEWLPEADGTLQSGEGWARRMFLFPSARQGEENKELHTRLDWPPLPICPWQTLR
jgi:hypothetical protein